MRVWEGRLFWKRVNKKPEQKIGKLRTLEPKLKQTTPIYQEPIKDRGASAERRKKVVQREKIEPASPIDRPKLAQIPGGDSMKELDLEKYKAPQIDPEDLEEEEGWRLAQISILPYVGTNSSKSDEIKNNFSFNVLWGTNGGVEGIEVGGFVNTVIRDVYGVQVAGLGNSVGGNVIGTQASGLFNIAGGRVQGVQASGLFNISGDADAIQFSGLFNVAGGDFSGIQTSGLFNTSKGTSGIQVAGLFNASGAKTKTQVSGLVNVAGDVGVGQVAGLMNIGKKVNGFQIGLINIADTIAGTPIGLLNIVKKGYNRVEFSAGEALLANFALKLGAKSFYNISCLWWQMG